MADERPPIIMHRRGSFLAPRTPLDSEALALFPVGKALKVKVTVPRNLGQHRLYWAMLGLVSENLDGLSTDALHGLVKLRCGYAVSIRTKTGVERIPGSIAFDKMDQPEFQAFFDKAVEFICSQVIPGMGKEALKREAEAMLGIAADA